MATTITAHFIEKGHPRIYPIYPIYPIYTYIYPIFYAKDCVVERDAAAGQPSHPAIQQRGSRGPAQAVALLAHLVVSGGFAGGAALAM